MIPGPDALAEAPELAALVLLDTALAVTTNALLAAYGELASGDFPDDGPLCLQAFAADALLLHVDGLQAALRRYHVALRQVDAARRACAPSGF